MGTVELLSLNSVVLVYVIEQFVNSGMMVGLVRKA